MREHWQARVLVPDLTPERRAYGCCLAVGGLRQLWPVWGSGRASERTLVPGDLTRPTVSLIPAEDRSEASAAALNLATGSVGSINMSVDIDGTTYAGEALGIPRESHGPSCPLPCM